VDSCERRWLSMRNGNGEKGVAVRERKPHGLWAWPEGLERYFARTMGDFGTWPFGRWHRTAPIVQEWLPDIDIYERDEKIVVKMDLPGLKPEDIEITLEGDMLVITGKREEEKEVKEENYYCSERAFGEFSRTIRLPEGVTAGSIEATFKEGVLEVTVPKPTTTPPESKVVKIAVK
jgi:HSP20 family protein